MCFNFSLTKEREYIEKRFKVSYQELDKLTAPVFNASAFSKPFMHVVCNDSTGIIQKLQWGLIPFWVKDIQSADKIRSGTYNARNDTILEKPSFRTSIKNKRCLVIADGFFEWHEHNGKKYPFYIYLKSHEAFAFAGIWDIWTDPVSGIDHKTFSIITTDANSVLERIHNTKKRMPAILDKSQEDSWISDSPDINTILMMLKPYPDDELSFHPVSKLILSKSADSNSAKVIEKHEYPELEQSFT